jgi:retron-type reverse transcriptase
MGELLEAIADPGNLAAAWAAVRANAGAAGVDGQTIAAFAADEDHQLASLRRRLLSAERYVPPPVRRVEIPKPDGRMRPLGIPTVADRVVQAGDPAGDRTVLRGEVLAVQLRLPVRQERPGGGVVDPGSDPSW